MKFLYRLLLNVLSFVLLQIPLQLIGIIILPILCLFYPIGSLPRIVRWFDSADPFAGRDTSVIDTLNTDPKASPYFWRNAYLTRYNWLAFRNPTNYFNYFVLGFVFDGTETYKTVGNLGVGDTPGRFQGFKQIELSNGKYEYLYIKKIKANSCFYFRMGWKITDLSNKKGDFCQQVFTISYRSYSGV